LLVNLFASLVRRFSLSWRKFGILLIHLGIIIMLAGGLATDLFSVSSFMRLKEGETKNYSDDSTRMELAVTDLTKKEGARVTAVPGDVLADGGTITHESLPFKVIVRGFFRNSDLQMIGQDNSSAVPAASNGAGMRISIKAIPRATKMDARDVMSAVLEIVPANGGASLGTWLVSDAMAVPQEFDLDGRHWSLELRPARYYKPYSLSLMDFTHETYPGTQIAKNFSSKVTLDDAEQNEHRQVVIYMNHPLRYRGDTYYQSGFEPDNSGTVLQVVRNPGYQAPYIACVLVSLGLIFQFTLHLTGFARRVKPAAAP
jgi:cytochrome c biogenesis protein ResB